MERSVGKFIASLRRASGMTQKELGEKLFVSDKTVSRWECGECEPELALIPAIADTFGITVDELLRGERYDSFAEVKAQPTPLPGSDNAAQHTPFASPPVANSYATGSAAAKKEKRLRALLDKKQRRFANLSAISVGLSLAGVIAAIICDLGFTHGLLGLCLSCVFYIAGGICQLCFYNSARLSPDEFDDLADSAREANTKFTLITVKIFFLLLSLFAFCLPIAMGGAYAGLLFEFWLPYGLCSVVLIGAVGYSVYKLGILPRLIKNGNVTLAHGKLAKHGAQVKLLKKCLIICGSVILAACVGMIILQAIGYSPFIEKQVFTDANEFKEYMEADYDRWYEEGYVIDSDYLYPPVLDNDLGDGEREANKSYGKVKDADGNEISYYYQKYTYHSINFSKDNSLPVTVITVEDYNNGVQTFYNILLSLFAIIIIAFISTACVYIIYSIKKRA